MAWANITIARSDIDALEGQAFKDNAYASDLALGAHDDDKLILAKTQLEDDIISKDDDNDYTESELLEAYADADDRNLLKRALVYKFLHMWFLDDTTSSDSLTAKKASYYERKYIKALALATNNVRSKLTVPKNNKQYQFIR